MPEPAFPPIGPIPGIPPIEEIYPFDVPAPLAQPMRLKTPEAKPFFLPPVNLSDPGKYRSAVKEAHKVTPIIDGKDVFTELETAIDKAESSVLIAFWAFDPQMKLVTDSSKTWQDLLMKKAAAGIKVRLLVSDFDPGLAHALHFQAWLGYFSLIDAAKTKSIPTDHFQMVVFRHEAEISAVFAPLIQNGLYDQLADNINKSANATTREVIFKNSPGLWDKLDFKTSTKKLEPKTKNQNYPAWPAVHHQKTVIIDGKYAYAGGLNVLKVYVDSQKHDKEGLPWHDIFVKVEGSYLVRVFIENYMWLWNQGRVQAENFLNEAYKQVNITLTKNIRATTELKKADVPAKLTQSTPPNIPGQVHRTVSAKAASAIATVPDVVRKDILEGYLLAIGLAEQYIYIENQYFREEEVGKAIIQQHKNKPQLKTIIVLPFIAEEFMKADADPISKHGAHLQYTILEEMMKEIGVGKHLGLYALKRNDKTIYVHSKLMIIDDKFASIGSANSNPRSYRMDTELDFTWYDPTSTKNLRLNLWNEILGTPRGLNTWKPSDFVDKWEKISLEIEDGKHSGFAVQFLNTLTGSQGLPILTPHT